MYYILIALISYIIGSIPTGYIVLKKQAGMDITQSGSGNMGAMNAYQTSKSKLLGISVLLLDLIKGLIVVSIARLIIPDDFLSPAIALTAAVFGHCYTIWLKFRGGRGLATAAGGLLIFVPHLVILWLVLWIIAFLIRRNVHFANSMALVLLAILSLSSKETLAKYSFPAPETSMFYALFTALLFSIIMSRHIVPLIDYFKKEKKKYNRDRIYEKK